MKYKSSNGSLTTLDAWPTYSDVSLNLIIILLFVLIGQYLLNTNLFVDQEIARRQTVIEQNLKASFPDEMANHAFTIDKQREAQRIRLGEGILFARGSAELKPEGVDLINKFAKFFQKNQELFTMIQVEGHTDTVHIKKGGEASKRFPTNWDLSTSRATSVVKQLDLNAEAAPSDIFEDRSSLAYKLVAIGRAWYDPVFDSTGMTYDTTLTRRIEFVLRYDSNVISEKIKHANNSSEPK